MVSRMTRLVVGALAVALIGCGGGGGEGTGGGSGGGGGEVSAVARIDLAPAVSILVIGKTVQLVPTALDANGNVLGNIPFTFTGTDSSVATIDQGLVTAVAEGAAVFSASANGVTSNFVAVSVVTEPPLQAPSDNLIADALAAGTIDEETALLYRVYAAFHDARLPLQYAGVDDDVMDSDALDVVRERWDTLTPATQALLEPFFAPPAYLGSWASLDRKPRGLLDICQQPTIDPNWAAIPATGGRVKVWFDTRAAGSLAQAQKVLAAFENDIWDKVTGASGLAMKPPKSDGAETGCNGGDDRFDVYLVDMGAHGQDGTDKGETKPNVTVRKAAPSFIMLDRSLSEHDLLGAAAHEFMHACQWAYDVGALGLSSYKWLKESTAQEAIDHVYPPNNLEQATEKVRAYLDTPAHSITASSDRQRPYGTYLFFQYLVRSGAPPVIGGIWTQTESTSEQLTAVDKGIPGGLAEQWPRYARTLWNDKPVSDQPASFAKWDSMTETPKYASGIGDLGGVKYASTTLAADAENMSVRFLSVGFTEAATRSLMFHNTWVDQRRAGKHISVQALWKTEDGVWAEEDWSQLEWIGFCRDQKDQRVESLIIVVANGEPSDGTLTAADAPTLERDNLPCWGLQGTGTRVSHDSQYASGSSTYTVTARYGGRPVTQLTDPVAGLLRVQIAGPMFDSGTGTFTESYTDYNGCSYQASGSWQHSGVDRGGDVASTWVINDYTEALPMDLLTQQAALIGSTSRAYSGDGTSNRMLVGTVTGPMGCRTSYDTGPALFLRTMKNSVELGGSPAIAQDDGSFQGSMTDGDDSFTWSFTPLREP